MDKKEKYLAENKDVMNKAAYYFNEIDYVDTVAKYKKLLDKCAVIDITVIGVPTTNLKWFVFNNQAVALLYTRVGLDTVLLVSDDFKNDVHRCYFSHLQIMEDNDLKRPFTDIFKSSLQFSRYEQAFNNNWALDFNTAKNDYLKDIIPECVHITREQY